MKQFILICFTVLLVQHVEGQKKSIDTLAYKSWKRIASKGISYNGNWLFYSTAYQDEREANANTITVENVKSSQQIILNNVNDLEFVGTENWLKYTQNDSVFLHDLASNKKRHWSVTDYTRAIKNSDFLFYNHFGPFVNGGALQKLVYYNLEENDSIVINNVKRFKAYNNDHDIIFVQEESGNVYLKQGPIEGPYKTYYTCNANEFGDFELNSNKTEGTFTLKSENSETTNLLYYFNLKSGKIKQILDFDSITCEDTSVEFLRKAYLLNTNTNTISLELKPHFDRNRGRNHAKTDVDIWKWNEGTKARRFEKLRGEKIKKKPARYIYNIAEKTCVKISSGNYDQVIAPNTENYTSVFETNKEKHEVALDWEFSERFDLYLVNLKNNSRTLLMEGVLNPPYWNSKGTYAVLFNSKKKVWMTLNPNDEKPVFKDIGSDIKYPLWNTESDMGLESISYDIAGWLDNGQTVVVYGKYDLWAIDLTGRKKSYSITKEYGRKHHLQFCFNKASFIGDLSLTKPLLLKSFNTKTKSSGIYTLQNNTVEKLVEYDDSDIKILEASGNDNAYLFSRESYSRFPDIWWADKSFKNQKQITNVNPQQNKYAWGTSKLVSWKTYKGEKNEGVIYLPEGYDASKTYPMLVHFYEKHTQELHRYHMPEFSTSSINIPTYVSQGYIVFQPDVHYRLNEPGMSAYNAAVSGVEYLIKKGIATKGKIGIQGHSFGGYQTSFLLTKTNIFNCAIVGSGVSNFTSSYLSYRGNGLSNMFKYEADQYRMKGPFFDEPDAYIKNSPVFSAKNIQTPTLIFHNDHDFSVPFQEGMSLFFALRRLGKPSWLINYKNERHTLNAYKNRIDWTEKMQSFFDFYLKDEKQPDWM
ncbi:alpha/beta hydrolase family protein [Thalassobellus citreus]|uniref:alpha/beta hydrolase family protein n=1 Tax=Thalassobellus citreus TaxID=3367752 RepID=UPI00379939AA